MFKEIIALSFFLGSCSTITPQVLDPEVYYQSDIKMEVNRRKGTGTLVVPYASAYKMEFKTPGDIDLLKITTCHRQHSTEDVRKGSGIFRMFKSKRKYEYDYYPNGPMEQTGGCPLFIEAYESGVKGRHSSGLIAFEDPGYKLKFTVKCNGRNIAVNGVSICESWNGLEQAFQFSKPVRWEASEEKCNLPKSSDDMLFEYPMPNRDCYYVFTDGEDFGRVHTVGYEQIAIRGK